MKKMGEDLEINDEDLDSFFFWKAFRKLIRSEPLFLFVVKVFLCAVSFFLMILIHDLVGEIIGK